MPGLVRAHSPSWFGNRHRKLSRCWLENRHRHYFPSWRLVSYGRTVLVDSVIVTENGVADDSEIITETLSTANAWIGQHTQSQVTRKSSLTMSLYQLENHHQNCFPSWRLVSSACTFPVDSVIITENIVANDSEIINETAYTAKAWIFPCTQSLLTR